jgi:hypothetical protein
MFSLVSRKFLAMRNITLYSVYLWPGDQFYTEIFIRWIYEICQLEKTLRMSDINEFGSVGNFSSSQFLHYCDLNFGVCKSWNTKYKTKIQQTKMLVTCLVICFYLGWSGSILQFRQNIIKVGSNSWLLTCSSNKTLSLPSYTGSALKRELNFCNGHLSLLYFWYFLK